MERIRYSVGSWFQERPQRQQTKERIKSLRHEVAGVVNEIYDIEPKWEPQKRYQISLNVSDWQVFSPSLLGFYPELANRDLTAIFIQRNPKLFLWERSPTLMISFQFNLTTSIIDFKLYSARSEIKASFKKRAGSGVTSYDRKNTKAGLTGELLRLNLIKEALDIILTIRESESATHYQESF